MRISTVDKSILTNIILISYLFGILIGWFCCKYAYNKKIDNIIFDHNMKLKSYEEYNEELRNRSKRITEKNKHLETVNKTYEESIRKLNKYR